MKILNVILSMDEASGGGGTERAFQLSRHWSRRGHDVTVLTTCYGMTSALLASLEGSRVLAIPSLCSRFPVPFPQWGRISQAVKQADVVHFCNHWSALSALAYLAVLRHKKPYVVSPLGALPLFGRSKAIKRLYNAVVGTRMIRNADRFVVATLAELPSFRAYGADQSRMAHMPNGINEEDYLCHDESEAFKTQIGVSTHPFILFIGRLNPIKGPDLLLDAFCRVKDTMPDLHLVMMGIDQGLLESLKKTAVRQSVGERVHFLGFISREDKSRVIHLARLLVVPSRQEAMSIVVLEAGIARKPVLITDQCGFNEVQSINGGKIVPATVPGLVDGLTALLGRPDELELMGENLWSLTKANYIWASIADRYAILFREVTTSKREAER